MKANAIRGGLAAALMVVAVLAGAAEKDATAAGARAVPPAVDSALRPLAEVRSRYRDSGVVTRRCGGRLS